MTYTPKTQSTLTVTDLKQAIEGTAFATTSSSTVTRTVTWALGAGRQYNDQTGHVYAFFAASGMSWLEAKSACEAESRKYANAPGYLVTITSANENAFIVGTVQGSGWIGAADAQSEGE